MSGFFRGINMYGGKIWPEALTHTATEMRTFSLPAVVAGTRLLPLFIKVFLNLGN